MVTARITVNGKEAPIAPAAPHTTVLDFLRERGLTGTKEGCARVSAAPVRSWWPARG